MNRSLKNSAAVLFATALTALAIYGGVSATSLALGSATHLTGASAASVSGSSAFTTGGTNTSTVAQNGSLTCPATGCTASTCHATTGRAPGQ